jgi:MFS family permease
MARSRRTVAPLLIGTFILRTCGGAATIVLGLFLAHLSTHRGILVTSIDVGLLAVVYFATELTLAPFMGAVSDRYGRRSFLIVGPLLGCLQVVLILFTPLSHPLFYLLCLQIISGTGSAMTTPVVLSYLAEYTAEVPSRRIRVMSLFELATSGGIAAGVVVGGFAWDALLRLSFLLLGIFYILAAICMALAPKVQQAIERANLRRQAVRYWRIIRTPRLFIFIPAWLAASALASIWLGTQLTFILSKPAHVPHQVLMGIMSGPGGGHRLSLVLGAYVLFFGLCLLFWAFFLNNIPNLRRMFTSIAGIFVACVALEGLNHHGLDHIAIMTMWLLLLAFGIFAESAFVPAALSYLADISEEAARDRGLLMGLYSVFLGVGQIVGNGFGGIFARQWGFDGLVYLTALLGVIALFFLLILFWVEKDRFQPPLKDADETEHRATTPVG